MTRLTLNPLTNKEAGKLLLEIAPHAEAAAQQICELCGYLPLAIRAAGSLLAFTVDLHPLDYAAQLKDKLKRLEHIGTEGVDIGVAASFSLSYERLDLEASRVFRLLSVFPGTFDAAAEEAVCADTGHTQLSDLVRRSLVLYHSSTKRYRLHDLTQLFAASKLSDEERAVGRKRHATHYKEVLAAANALYLEGGETLARGLALFDLEWSNIRACHAWIAAEGVEADEDTARLGVIYANTGLYILNLRLHARDRIRWLEIALAAARRLKDRNGEGKALGNLGHAYHELGETPRSFQFYEQALLIARELGDYRSEGIALGNLGVIYKQSGELERATDFFEKHLLTAREAGDRRGECNALCNLGTTYRRRGETKRAIHLQEESLTIARELGDRRAEGYSLGNLGVAYADLGETELAVQFQEQSLSIARELGDRTSESLALLNMSLELNQLGQRTQAIKHAEHSLTIYEQIEDPNAAKVREVLAALRGTATPKRKKFWQRKGS
jgi:tetratricopeptide (TPR) repeat protein